MQDPSRRRRPPQNAGGATSDPVLLSFTCKWARLNRHRRHHPRGRNGDSREEMLVTWWRVVGGLKLGALEYRSTTIHRTTTNFFHYTQTETVV